MQHSRIETAEQIALFGIILVSVAWSQLVRSIDVIYLEPVPGTMGAEQATWPRSGGAFRSAAADGDHPP
jgi:hypothetical protein